MTAFTADSAPGMLGMMNGLSPAMQSDLASVRGADESTLHALLPHHRKMIESTLAQMNAEMRQLHMPHTTAWTALVDSIRQDLTLLEDRTGADLIRTVIENAARVERAAAMHQRMMDKHG